VDSFWKAVRVLLAVGGVYIAYQQFRFGRERLKLDLFEKRFAVFAAVSRFLSTIATEGKVQMEQLGETLSGRTLCRWNT
jgi:hypothetical protein